MWYHIPQTRVCSEHDRCHIKIMDDTNNEKEQEKWRRELHLHHCSIYKATKIRQFFYQGRSC